MPGIAEAGWNGVKGFNMLPSNLATLPVRLYHQECGVCHEHTKFPQRQQTPVEWPHVQRCLLEECLETDVH
eukprot:309581-Amphidinium_carterae.1